MLTAERRHQVLLDKLLHEADEYITANEPRIRARVRESTAWLWQRLSMDEKVADGVVAVLRKPSPRSGAIPRIRCASGSIRLSKSWRPRLATSPEYREEIVVHTRKLLDHPALRTYAAGVWRDIRDNLREDAFSADSVLKAWLREMIEAATQALLRNDGLRGRLNNWMHEVAVEVVQVAPTRRRRAHRGYGARLGYRNGDCPDRATGGRRPPVYPHQRHLDRRAG